jgi:hypothetical protein
MIRNLLAAQIDSTIQYAFGCFLFVVILLFITLYLSVREDAQKNKKSKQEETARKKAEARAREAETRRKEQMRQRAKEIESKKFYARERTSHEAHYEILAYEQELEKRYIYETDPSMWTYTDLTTQEIRGRIAYLTSLKEKEPEPSAQAPQEIPLGVALGTKSVSNFNVYPYRKELTPVVLPDAVRDRDLYIVGKKRTGKSTATFEPSKL